MKDAALRLVGHLRRCLAALFNGDVRAGRRDPAFWIAPFSLAPRYFRYPVLSPEVRRDCAALGIPTPPDPGRRHGVPELLALLRESFARLPSFLADQSVQMADYPVAGWFDPQAFSGAGLPEIAAMFSSFRSDPPPGISMYLHGSLADRTQTPFSDVDDLLIVGPEALESTEAFSKTAARFARLAKQFQIFDPYQHHGHFVLTELDLVNWDPAVLPPVVLAGALRISGGPSVSGRLLGTPGGLIRNASNTIEAVEMRLFGIARRGGLNAFILKALVGEIAILPAYLFQARGDMFTKPEAIARAGELFSPKAIAALDWAARVRKEFAILVEHPRINSLRRLMHRVPRRRYLAERLVRSWAPWVDAGHPLGVSSQVAEAASLIVQESRAQVEALKSLCE